MASLRWNMPCHLTISLYCALAALNMSSLSMPSSFRLAEAGSPMERFKISSATALTKETSSTDPHTKASPPREEIPILDSILHMLSMSVLVFLRYRFGYAYLKPNSLFLVIGLALTIFTGFAWTSRIENHVWQQFLPFCAFGFTWLIAYCGHWFSCNVLQWLGKAPLDNSSGISLLVNWYLETILAFVAGALLFYIGEELIPLGMWLMLAAIALSIKEARNTWYRSRIETVRITSERKSEALSGLEETKMGSPPIRKPSRIRKKRLLAKPASTPDLSRQKIKFANILGIEPRYTLIKAEKAYRQRQREFHPDSNLNANSNPQFQQLREAIEFFRNHHH